MVKIETDTWGESLSVGAKNLNQKKKKTSPGEQGLLEKNEYSDLARE